MQGVLFSTVLLRLPLIDATHMWSFYISDNDDCEFQTCNGRGICRDQVNGYECQCQSGYSGKDCETGKSVHH